MSRRRRTLLGRKGPRKTPRGRGREGEASVGEVDDAQPSGLTEDFVPPPPAEWGSDDGFTLGDEPDSASGTRPPLDITPPLGSSFEVSDDPDPHTDEILRDDVAPQATVNETWLDDSTPLPPRPSTQPPRPASPAQQAPADLGFGLNSPDDDDDDWSSFDDDDDSEALIVQEAKPLLESTTDLATDVEPVLSPDAPTDDEDLGSASTGQGDFLDDLYNSFDFDSAPPTDEVTAAVYEDVTQHHPGSMEVPESPAMESLIRKATPMPVSRRAGPTGSPDLPDYDAPAVDAKGQPDGPVNRFLASSTPVPTEREVPPTAAASGRNPSWTLDDEFSTGTAKTTPEESAPANPVGRGATVVGIGLALVIGVVALAIIPTLDLEGLVPESSGPGKPPAPALSSSPTPQDGTLKGVEVRSSLHGKPTIFGEDDGADAPPPPPAPREISTRELTQPAPAPAPLPDLEVELIAEEEATPPPPPEPARAAPAPAPAPAAAPAPRAAPAPEPEAPAPAAATAGTLNIRSNRRVIVYVNDSAIGYTPVEHPVPVGAYSIRAMVPGMPDTQQTRQAAVETAGQAVAVTFSF